MRAEDILELTGETSTSDVKELTLRNQKLTSLGDFAEHVNNLIVLSVSHNQINSLQGLVHLRGLQSLNVNFNGLSSLDGIELCSELRSLYLSSNRIRDLLPIEGLQLLSTLHLFRNNVTSLEQAVASLAVLPKLRELELGANPCSTAEDYKQRLILQLQLDTLDGEAVSSVDRDLAVSYYESRGEVPPCSASDVQVLSLQAEDAAQEPTLRSETSEMHDEPGSHPRIIMHGSQDVSRIVTGTSQLQLRHGLPPRPDSQGGLARPLSGVSSTGSRPGTAMPSGSSAPASARPSTAPGSSPNSVQLYSSELLNDHPVVLEYLAKHVLQEGLQLTQGSAKSSFAQRLRSTTAVMNACQGMDARELAGRDLVPSTAAAKAAAVEQLVSANTPHETIRQLVRLCEVLIKEVESARSRPGSSEGRPGTASGMRPPSAGRPMTPAPGPSGSSSSSLPSGMDEVSQLRAEKEKLQREVKSLTLENQNMYWLAEEVKRLKGELRAAQEGKR